MISAKEAKQMTGESEINVMLALTGIDNEVKAAATRGCTYVFHSGVASFATESKSISHTATPLMEAVAKKLQALGYNTRFETQIIKRGGSVGSFPAEERRYGIFISW